MVIGDIYGFVVLIEFLINVLFDCDIFESVDVIVIEFGNSYY